MKKAIIMFFAVCCIGILSAKAQETKQKNESTDSKTKIKPITTPKDKVHNVIHPKHKVAHGKKYVHKNKSGKTTARVKHENATPIKKD